jgi:hypothetical protein
VRLRFLEANENLEMEGLEERGGKVHVLRGDDPSRWRRDLRTFGGRGSADNGLAWISVDWQSRAALLVGGTNSFDFPTTPGTFNPIWNGTPEIFITRLNAEGTGLVFSTF